MEFIKANKQPVGIAACFLLIVGCFVPLFSVFGLVTENYFKDGEGDGVLLIVLTVISFLLVLTNRYRGLFISGGLSALLIVYDFFDVLSIDLVDLEWGWFLLFAGVILLLVVAFAGYQDSKVEKAKNVPDKEDWAPLE